ncbi:V-type proton ATPase 116 kDa subunit a-like [Lingula anatina]|uniref:V-type proton ATPase subunit a n=1 Tax=Lingula anatina TaxID=7574 RepID=A0A1S3K8S8_LINAN|nr:V-type proton ATPase 116 kDa subunit a-like [Lingula anatina]|eukprot:XP_013418907.1 V-type proton ATPase 116 kDa subunit a-like [Lingula anatina]
MLYNKTGDGHHLVNYGVPQDHHQSHYAVVTTPEYKGDQVNKSVFIIFFQGDQLKSRVKKICEGFRATLYPCPETPAERREMAIGVMTRIEDLNTVLGQTQDHRHRVLVAAAKNIKNWFVKVKKIKAIYHTLNMFNLDVTQKCLIAECWCPVAELDKIQLALRRGTDRSGSSVPSILNRMTTKEAPPTYHKTNKFTGAFQSIIDAYGVNTYGEMNPTPYTIITFPFLFSLMFGDAGHGFVMFLFALVLVIKEKQIMASKLDDEVLGQTQDHRHRVLVAAAKNIKNWFVKVKKIKAIYHTLNMFNLDVTQKCLIAECWCPVAELDKIQLALRRGTDRSGSSVPSILNRMTTKEAPPTYHKTNKFTGAFQSIIDAYGVNTYGEMNPTPYTIITFPFLFSLMFGDAGHGFVMFLFALVLVIKEKQIMASKLDDEIANTFFGGRYIIMMMGLFSCYSGMIYNDIFSRSTNIFGSSWTVPESEFVVNGTRSLKHFPSQLQGDPNMTAYFTRGVYPFGIDPVWQLAENKITYTNSFKMKLSIIMGVFQMMFGVWLGLFNHMHFKNKLSIFCEFIPQVLFLLCMFGYLVLLVFVKWFVFNAIDNGMNTNCAPSLLIGLINMFLFTYPKRGQAACSTITWYGGAASFFVINNGDVTQEEGQGQQVFQIILVLLALLCVPWMLLTKPLLLKFSPSIRASYMASKKHGEQAESAPADTTSEQEIIHHDAVQVSTSGAGLPAPGGAKEEDFDFAEVFIHTAIHTIEYCLGTISHTASYLRLWALSLAHAQLSEVLWDMVLQIGLRQGRYYGGVILVPIFAAWVVLTIAILLLMEGLSAFLHTLRLHWVEFQSKFYKGEGYAFHAFDFQQIIETAEE